jgi:putative transcriptional regulator
MADIGYLTNQFLIAMPNLLDPNFFHSVTYICEHNERGAMGIVINQPVDLTVGELMQQMGMRPSSPDMAARPVFRGGPVDEEHGFVLHQPAGDWDSTMIISAEVAITTSNDIIRAIIDQGGPQRYLVALGYAGWGPGQLEQEILDNTWLSGPANTDIIFDTPVDQRWEAAAALLGVDIHQLTGDAGHA